MFLDIEYRKGVSCELWDFFSRKQHEITRRSEVVFWSSRMCVRLHMIGAERYINTLEMSELQSSVFSVLHCHFRVGKVSQATVAALLVDSSC